MFLQDLWIKPCRYVRRQRARPETDRQGVYEGDSGNSSRPEDATRQHGHRSDQVNLSTLDTSARDQVQISRGGQTENPYFNSQPDVQISEYERLDTTKVTTAQNVYEKITGL